MRSRMVSLALGCALVATTGCHLLGSSGTDSGTAGKASKTSKGSKKGHGLPRKQISACIQDGARMRDWQANPAIVKMEVTGGKERALFAMSDVHGHFEAFFHALVEAKVIRATTAEPKASGFEWVAGNAVLVHAGDLINKGEESVKTLKFAQNLEIKAEAAGGKAIFLAGNHEIGFIGNPTDSKFDVFVDELDEVELERLCGPATSTDPDDKEPLGLWLAKRPAAALVGGIYLSHSGWSQLQGEDSISKNYRSFVESNDWDAPFLCGDAAKLGFFNANDWWGNTGDGFTKSLAALGVKQVAFGHDPNAFEADGFRGDIAGHFHDAATGHALVKLDVGIFQGHAYAGVLKCDATDWLPGGGCGKLQKLVLPKGYKPGKGGTSGFVPVPLSPRAPKEGKHAPRDGC